jgi:hypothetical protein
LLSYAPRFHGKKFPKKSQQKFFSNFFFYFFFKIKKKLCLTSYACNRGSARQNLGGSRLAGLGGDRECTDVHKGLAKLLYRYEYAIFFNSRYPIGHFIRALGPIGDKATENEVLLLEHDIPHSSFSEAVLDCLPTLPWDITPQGNLGSNDVFVSASQYLVLKSL